MQKQNPATLKVRILPGDNKYKDGKENPDYAVRGIITGPGTSVKEGEIAEFPAWTAKHLVAAERAEFVTIGRK